MIEKKKLAKALNKALNDKKDNCDLRKLMLASLWKKGDVYELSKLVDKIELRNSWLKDFVDFPKVVSIMNSKKDINDALSKLESERKYILKCSGGSGAFLIDLGKNFNQNNVKKFIAKNKRKIKYWQNGEIQYCLNKNNFFFEEHIGKDVNEIKLHIFDNYMIPTLIPNRELNNSRFAWDGEDMKKRCNYLHGNYPIDEYNGFIEKSAITKAIKIGKEIQRKLGRYARIDFLVTKDKIYFGEITFTHNAGRISFGGDEKMKQKFIKNYMLTDNISFGDVRVFSSRVSKWVYWND